MDPVRTALGLIVARGLTDPLVAEAATVLGAELERCREVRARIELIAHGTGRDARAACYIRDGVWPEDVDGSAGVERVFDSRGVRRRRWVGPWTDDLA